MKMTPDQIKQKKRLYQQQIQQFLPQKNHSIKINQSHQQQQKIHHYHSVKQTNCANEQIKITKFLSSTSPNRKSLPKTEIKNNLHENSGHLNYKSLLSSISKQISLMNEKISTSIHQNQSSLLKQYEDKMKSKIFELNKLKSITNQQMIKQKTILRKQQLQREKKQLIQGNFYYDSKLNQLKKDLDKLIDKRDTLKKTLSIHTQQHIEQLEINNYQNKNINQTKQISNALPLKNIHQSNKHYISYQDEFVENVLKKYNQKSPILLQSISSNPKFDKKSNSDHNDYDNDKLTLKMKQSLFLPKIKDKSHHSLNRSLNPQTLADEYLSYRKKKGQFNKAHSISRLKNSQNKQSLVKQSLHSNNIKDSMFLKHPKTLGFKIHNKTVSFGSLDQQNANKDSIKIKISEKLSSTVQVKYQPFNHLSKQQLQQLVLHKKSKPTSTQRLNLKKQKKLKQLQSYDERLRYLEQKLNEPLQIQFIFKNCLKQYYGGKRENGIRKIKQLIQNQSNGKDPAILQEQYEYSFQANSRQLQEYEEEQEKLPELDQKKVLKLLESNQFDKKALMDRLFQDTSFKKHIYDIIISELSKSKFHHINHPTRPTQGFYGMSG